MAPNPRALAGAAALVVAVLALASEIARDDPRSPGRDGATSAGSVTTTAAPDGPSRAAEGTGGNTAADAVPFSQNQPRSFTLVATGDVLLHSRLLAQAQADAAAAGRPSFDFGPLLAGVAPLVSDADLAVCHLETPTAPVGGPYAGYPAFSVPPEIVPALTGAGYDACTTASNHIYDRGADGIDRTLAALDAAGIRHAGSARSPQEASAITLLDVDAGGTAPARVALLSYTYGFNGVPAPRGETWRSNPIEEARILADAARARGAGADVVVVALHWGDEYQHEPNAQQSELGPRLIRSPAIDVLLGHHAHVVQPVEAVDGEWIVYGLGNLVAHHGTAGSANEEGLLVRFTFTEPGVPGQPWRVNEARYAPLLVVKDPAPVRLVDVASALADEGTRPALRARLQAARDRTAAVVDQRGASMAGLQPLRALSGA